MKIRHPLAIVWVAAALVFAGCDKQDPIHVYKTDKDPAQPLMPAGHPPLPDQHAQQAAQPQSQEIPISFKVPEKWKPLGSMGMAAAVFEVDQNPPLNVTVTPLGAQSGGVVMNVNRWEQQLGLDPTPEANISKVATPVKIDGQNAHLVDLTSPKAEGKPQARMLAAIVPSPTAVWYFKLMGPADKVAPHKQEFDDFVKSVTFKPSQQPVGNAAGAGDNPHAGMKMPGTGTGDNPHAGMKMPGTGTDPHAGVQMPNPHGGTPTTNPTATADAGKLDGLASYKLAAGWQLDPTPRMMRVGTILVGTGDKQAQLIISRLGSFGDPLANLNRWRGQVGMQPVNDVKDNPASKMIKTDKGEIAVYDFEGPADAGDKRMRLLVGKTEFKGQVETWFFKLVGPYETVGKAKPDFEAFLQSLKFE